MWTDTTPPTQHALDCETTGRRAALVMMWAYAVLSAQGHVIADMANAFVDKARGKWVISVEIRPPEARHLIARRMYFWRVGDHELEPITPIESMAHVYAPRRYDLELTERDREDLRQHR
jgi:hypothetical protein